MLKGFDNIVNRNSDMISDDHLLETDHVLALYLPMTCDFVLAQTE